MKGGVFRRLHPRGPTSIIHRVHAQTMTVMDVFMDVDWSGRHTEAQLLMHSSTHVLRDQTAEFATTLAVVGKHSVGDFDGKNSCNYIPPLPISLIVEHILPYLDRDTYDNFIVVSKEVLDASKMLTVPPWPEKCIEIGTGISALAFSPTGRRVVCGCEDGSVRLLGSSGRFEILSGHQMAVISVAFSPNEMFLVSSSRDFSICVWQLTDSTIKFTHILKGQETPVHSISFFPCGNVFAACGCDNSVRLWNASNGRCITTIPHSGILESVAISPDGRLLASAMWDGFIQIWEVSADFNIDEGKVVGRGLPSTRVEFSADGRYLYGCKGFRIRRWNIYNWSCIILAGRREERVCSVCLSPNAEVVAYGERDGTIQLSTVADSMRGATLKATMRGHRRKCDFVFSPNGKTVASGSVDGSLRLWGV
jgi:WD40 repeat protein